MGRRRKDPSHSVHRQNQTNPTRGKHWKDMIDLCAYCNQDVLWEESVKLPGGLLAHPECRDAVNASRARGSEAAERMRQNATDSKEIEDLLQ